MIIDESTEFGARVAEHLRTEIVVWMTTVHAVGRPAADAGVVPVGGRRVGGDVQPREPARRNLEANPNVSLNFDGDGRGGGIVVLSGRATVDRDGPRANEVAAYIEKYATHIERIAHTPESFGGTYPVPVRIELTKLRGH